MEVAPVSGCHQGGRGRLRGSEGFRGRGWGRSGRGGGGPSPFRGRGGGTPFWGGRGRGRGGPSRGVERAWPTPGDGEVSQTIYSNDSFLVPNIENCLTSRFRVRIRNLPLVKIQDTRDIDDFIAKYINVPIKKLLYEVPMDKSGSLAAMCIFAKFPHFATCLQKLHGQVFRDHHLLVERFQSFSPKIAENCIKIKNLSITVTEETLWRFFESCGHLGMIYLKHDACKAKLEALVNFEDSESLMNALKLDGATLDKTPIQVVNLDWNLAVSVHCEGWFPESYLESMLENINVAHIEYCVDKVLTAFVYLSDKKSYSAALSLSGQKWNDQTFIVKPTMCHLYMEYHDKRCWAVIEAVTQAVMVKLHKRRRLLVLYFESTSKADTALKASPLLIDGKLCTLWDSDSKIPISTSKCKVAGEEAEDEDRESEVDETEDKNEDENEFETGDDVVNKDVYKDSESDESMEGGVGVMSKPSNGVKILQKHSYKVDEREKMLKELEDMKRKMMQLTEALGVVSNLSDSTKIEQKQPLSTSNIKRKRDNTTTEGFKKNLKLQKMKKKLTKKAKV